MGLLKKVIFILIPITTLLCCIAFGISAIFPTENITYLQTITTETGQSYKYYNWTEWLFNFDISYLKEVITSTIDFSGISNAIDKFIYLWQDGYDLGDIGKTLAIGFILIGNIIIFIINLIALPLRLLFGLLLTLFNLIGINIKADSVILNFIRLFIEKAIIPSIPIPNF